MDDAQIANLVGYFAERLNRVFAYFFFVIEFEEDQDFGAENFENDRAWSLQTIQDACLHTTLLALRDVDDVLTPRGKSTHADDFRISDLGYSNSLRFLSEEERFDINKRMAHSTVTGSVATTFRWKVWEIVARAVPQALQFLDWVIENKPLPQFFEAWCSASYCRSKTIKIFNFLKERVETQSGKSSSETFST